MSIDTITERAITAEDVAVINAARNVLDAIAKRAVNLSWDAPLSIDAAPAASSADFGRIHAMAEVADDILFTVLNWANSHRVIALTEGQLHNRSEEDIARAAEGEAA